MYPVFCKRLARQRLGLRDLVLVVGEDEVASASVYVDLLTERPHIHGGALYVPAGPAFAPRGLPERLALFCRLPQREIQGIALVVLVLDAHALPCVLQVSAGQFAVAGEGIHREVHVAFRGGVGVSLLYKTGDEVLDALHGASRTQPYVGVVHLQPAHLGVDLLDHHLRILVRGDARFVRARDDLVVHVRVVARVRHVVALFFEIFAYDVVDERLIGVSDVRVAGHGDAARVHLHFVAFQGREILFPFGERIVYLHFIPLPVPQIPLSRLFRRLSPPRLRLRTRSCWLRP